MDGLVGFLFGKLWPYTKTQLPAGDHQLPMDLAPLTHAHVRKILALAELAELILTQRLTLRLVVTPQRNPRQKVRARMLEPRMSLIRLGLFVCGPLTWVLNRHGTDDHQDFGQAPEFIGCQQHAPQAGIDWQTRKTLPEGREFASRRDCAQFLKQAIAVAHHLGVGRINERKTVNVAEAQLEHAQHHRRKIGAVYFRISKFGAAQKVLLAVEPKTHTI